MRDIAGPALGRRPFDYIEPEVKAAGIAATVVVLALGVGVSFLIVGLVWLAVA